MPSILELLKGHPVRRYQAGDVVLAQGGKSGVLLVLLEGSFEVRKGEFVIDVIAESGAIFGEISVLADVGHSADVIAAEPSAAYVIESPRDFMRANPDFHLALSELLARRLNYMVSYLSNVKKQYEGHDHIGMVDQVLESLVVQQPRATRAKSRGVVRNDTGE